MNMKSCLHAENDSLNARSDCCTESQDSDRFHHEQTLKDELCKQLRKHFELLEKGTYTEQEFKEIATPIGRKLRELEARGHVLESPVSDVNDAPRALAKSPDVSVLRTTQHIPHVPRRQSEWLLRCASLAG